MTLTAKESEALAQRDTLNNAEREVVDATMDKVEYVAKSERVPFATDDRLAKLEAAVITFIIDSRNCPL